MPEPPTVVDSVSSTKAERNMRELAAGGLAGLAAGLVAGGGARLAMRLVAVAIGQPVAFTVEGTTGILLIGAVVGCGGGALYVGVGRWLPARRWLRPVVFAASIVVAFIVPTFAGDPGEFRLALLLGAILFGLLILAYAVVLEALLARARDRLSRPPDPATGAMLILGAVGGALGLVLLAVGLVTIWLAVIAHLI